jgi:serine/threonine protein kinase
MSGPEMAQGALIAGRYRLDQHLGEGGMGTVWSATHAVTRRCVAMKFLRTAIQHRKDVRQRFLREAQAASALRHPNVVEVLDVFDLEDGSPVMVMELLEGETLGQKLSRDERLSSEETAAIMLPVISAVGAAHAVGVVHRDLKPDNIFLSPNDQGVLVKVLDFGIAKLSAEYYVDQGQSALVTEAGSLLGTPCYMAPEQISNKDVDHRADIWSLGVILYECLSGTRPVEGENMAEVVVRLLNEAITPLDRLAPELPHGLTALVQQMLSRDAKRRPQDLSEVHTNLSRYTHVRSPSFGLPRSRSTGPQVSGPPALAGQRNSSDVRVEVPVVKSKSTPLPLPGAATMQSAPAVGIDGPGGAHTAPVRTRAAGMRTWLFGLAAGVAGLAIFWTLVVGRTASEAPRTEASARAADDGTRSAAQPTPSPGPSPVVTQTAALGPPQPAASGPSNETANGATATKPTSEPASETKPSATRPPVKRASKVPTGVARPHATAASEETLFPGRK